MLILRRRLGEAILVGGEVEIEVIEISRSRVKLGVRAPGHVAVTRKETLAVARENVLASDLIAERGADVVGELLGLLHADPHRSATPVGGIPVSAWSGDRGGGERSDTGQTKPKGDDM